MADINSNDNGPSGDKSRGADQKDDSLSQDQNPRSAVVRESPKHKSPETRPPSEQRSTEKNIHWEGVIHYQDARPTVDSPQNKNASRSQEKSIEWQGVKETHAPKTNDKDQEVSRPAVAQETPTHSREADRSSDRFISR